MGDYLTMIKADTARPAEGCIETFQTGAETAAIAQAQSGKSNFLSFVLRQSNDPAGLI
jgi:hypothetical protein